MLIIKWDRIWDAVWSIYFVKMLKNTYPNLQIDIVCNDYNSFVFEENIDLFNTIEIIKENPPRYFIKYFVTTLLSGFGMFSVFFRHKKLWKLLKSNRYDFVFNLTGRKYFIVSKYLGKVMWGWLWVFNGLYDYPLIWHNEIWSKKHIVYKWFEWIAGDFKYISKLPLIKNIDVNKICIFVGWKSPDKIEMVYYKWLSKQLEQLWYEVSFVDDKKNKKIDYIHKEKDWLYINTDKLSSYVSNFDIFIGVDGGVLHYVSQFVPTISIFLSTNQNVAYPFCWQTLKNNYIEDPSSEVAENGQNLVIASTLPCKWCFELWCGQRLCKKTLDKKTEIVIKLFKDFYKKNPWNN